MLYFELIQSKIGDGKMLLFLLLYVLVTVVLGGSGTIFKPPIREITKAILKSVISSA